MPPFVPWRRALPTVPLLLPVLALGLLFALTSPAWAAPATQPAELQGQAVRLVLMADGAEACYRAQELLVGNPLPNEAVGTTRAVVGELLIGPDGAMLAEQSRIVVDLRTLKSDQDRRDNYIQRNTLETHLYPTAELVPRLTPGLPLPLPTSGEGAFQLVGDLTVHGVTQPTTWEVAVSYGEQEIAGLASTRVRMTDFGMEPPRAGPVVSIEDELALELAFRLMVLPATATGPSPTAGNSW